MSAPVPRPAPKVLSVVIPAFNEERFIGTLLAKIQAVDLTTLGTSKEIIVVDDCSRDRTAEIAGRADGVTLVRMPVNGGKGRAVRAGIARATGEFLIIQDADLEYEPGDYVPMLEALLAGRADAVYGSRYMKRPSRGRVLDFIGGRHPNQSWAAYLGGRSLSVIALACTGRYLTDTVTALKLFKRQALTELELVTTGFELDHEITSKVLARGRQIIEVPIRYNPRTKAEGKKIGLRDWFVGARTFLRFRRG
jgi:dolichol-phosphate mannosyltransferase